MTSPAQKQETLDLSEAHLRGDEARVETLLHQYRNYLMRVVEARLDVRLRRRVDASDIVQEAQIEAMRSMQDFLENPVVPVRVWLRKLVVERLIMAQRKHLRAACRAVSKEQHTDGDAVSPVKLLQGNFGSPSRIASKRDSAGVLRRCLEELPEADREIILMHLYEGLTSQESGAALGIEPATARKRLGRAVKKLRDLLEVRNLGASSL